MGEPIYVGNAKRGHFPNSVSIGFNMEHLKTLAHNLNEGGWVNLIVSPQKKNPDKYSVKIDDWKPENAERSEERAEQKRQGFQPNDQIESTKDDGLPF